MNLRISLIGAMVILLTAQAPARPADFQIDGTTGAPLGGIGSGAIKFKAHDGTFTATFWTPCGVENFHTNNNNMGSTQFQFYSKRGSTVQTDDKLSSVIVSGRSDDDAVYPIHTADMGTVNGIRIDFLAFSPMDLQNVDLMCYPYAFYQFTLTNAGTDQAVAAVAFQTVPPASPVYAVGKGLHTTSGHVQRAIYAKSDDPAAVISVGNDNGFLTAGQCSNAISGAQNRVAVKVVLAPGQSRHVKFVFAWRHSDSWRFYYSNHIQSAGSAADTGLVHFDRLRDNALAIVNRVRASTLPSWLENQCLVSLCNLTNNSMYTQDGRYAHTEGMWNTNGTMDQMWHARWIYAQMLPSMNWQELEYWARTQKTSPEGQIHHDLGEHYNPNYMCEWDDRQHTDYRDIDRWVDLDCAFVISVYETFIATDDHDKLDWFWPYVKKAAQRILTLAQQYPASGYTGTFSGTQNSYDAGGEPDPYNASLAAVTYRIMSALAGIKGEPSVKTAYDNAFTTIADSFRRRYLSNNFPAGRLAESVMAGQWLAYALKLGELFPTSNIDYSVTALDNYYYPASQGLGYNGGTYDEWAPYIVSHYGGLLLLTSNTADWHGLQYDWYQRNFLNRNNVYNQLLSIPAKVGTPTYLAGTTQGDGQYISVPVVWRNFYSLVGYMRNRHSGELWLQPVFPAELNHGFRDALIMSPEGFAAISASESGTGYTDQTIDFTPDDGMSVSALYLWDKGTTAGNATVNGVAVPVVRQGTGHARQIRIPVDIAIPAGETLHVTMTGSEVRVSIEGTRSRTVSHGKAPLRVPFLYRNGLWIVETGAGPHLVEVYNSGGALVAGRSGTGGRHYAIGRGADIAVETPGVYTVRIRQNTGDLSASMIVR